MPVVMGTLVTQEYFEDQGLFRKGFHALGLSFRERVHACDRVKAGWNLAACEALCRVAEHQGGAAGRLDRPALHTAAEP